MHAGIILKRQARRITFEYSLVAGVNDGDEDAAQLVRQDQGHELPCKSDSC